MGRLSPNLAGKSDALQLGPALRDSGGYVVEVPQLRIGLSSMECAKNVSTSSNNKRSNSCEVSLERESRLTCAQLRERLSSVGNLLIII